MAKSKKKRLRGQCDRLWYEVCIKKYGNQCDVCGGKARIQVHHFFPKGLYGILRYDLDNGISLCMGCHFKHHTCGDPTIHQTIVAKRGQKWYNDLKEKSKSKESSYQTIKYYENTIIKLNKYLNG